MPLWLQAHAGLTGTEVQKALEQDCGVVGLAGTVDMREVLSRAANGDAGAALARDVYVHALKAGIARMTASNRGSRRIGLYGWSGGGLVR